MNRDPGIDSGFLPERRRLSSIRHRGLRRTQVTRNKMPGTDFLHRRLFAAASLHRIRATRMEATARRGIDRARYVAGEDDTLSLDPWIRHRHRGQQSLGIGMLRMGEERALIGQLDDLPEVHD